jgi:hypothetical protein
MFLDKLYLTAQRIKHSDYTDKNTYYDYYTLNNTGTDG